MTRIRTKEPLKTTDAIAILHRRYVITTEARRMLEIERLNASIARDIYDLRLNAGLTQSQLAKLVGTTASVISRLEDADYSGHSLSMLQRIAAALNRRIAVSFLTHGRAA